MFETFLNNTRKGPDAGVLVDLTGRRWKFVNRHKGEPPGGADNRLMSMTSSKFELLCRHWSSGFVKQLTGRDW